MYFLILYNFFHKNDQACNDMYNHKRNVCINKKYVNT